MSELFMQFFDTVRQVTDGIKAARDMLWHHATEERWRTLAEWKFSEEFSREAKLKRTAAAPNGASNNEGEIGTDNSEAEVVADNSEAEVDANNNEAEAVADKSAAEAVADNSDAEAEADNSEAEVVADNSEAEVDANNSEAEVVADKSAAEAVADNSDAEAEADNSETGVVADNSESEADADNSEAEVGTDIPEAWLEEKVNGVVVTPNVPTANGKTPVPEDIGPFLPKADRRYEFGPIFELPCESGESLPILSSQNELASMLVAVEKSIASLDPLYIATNEDTKTAIVQSCSKQFLNWMNLHRGDTVVSAHFLLEDLNAHYLKWKNCEQDLLRPDEASVDASNAVKAKENSTNDPTDSPKVEQAAEVDASVARATDNIQTFIVRIGYVRPKFPKRGRPARPAASLSVCNVIDKLVESYKTDLARLEPAQVASLLGVTDDAIRKCHSYKRFLANLKTDLVFRYNTIKGEAPTTVTNPPELDED